MNNPICFFLFVFGYEKVRVFDVLLCSLSYLIANKHNTFRNTKSLSAFPELFIVVNRCTVTTIQLWNSKNTTKNYRYTF